MKKIKALKKIALLTIIVLFTFSNTVLALCLDPLTGELTDDCDLEAPLDTNIWVLIVLSIIMSLYTFKNRRAKVKSL